MKKLTTFLFSVLTLTTCFGQTNLGDSMMTQEFNFFYKDSIDNKVSFGDYEPTGFVSLDDGSLIVSTQFSFDFPGHYQMPDSFTKENFKVYFEQQKTYEGKSHISSGSIFKLNSDFEKKWEVFFKDKRVMKIGKLPDQSVVVAGDRVDMEKFWMAQIDTAGKIIWQKEYKLKSNSSISNMVVDSLANTFLLIETERIIPISMTKYYGKRRIRFFQQTEMEGNIYLLKISSNGHLIWTKSLDKTKRFQKFGQQLFIQGNIYASASYEGFIKQNNDWVKKQGETSFEINQQGKIIKTTEIKNHFLYHNSNNWFSVTATEDTLIFYSSILSSPIPTDTFTFVNPVKSIWIYGFLPTNNFIYLLGSKDHNLGCIVVQLDKDNHYIGHWNDNRNETTELVDAIVKSDGTIIVISKCFKRAKDTNNELTTYINLSVIKKNGT